MNEKPEALWLAEELKALNGAKVDYGGIGRLVASRSSFAALPNSADALLRQHAEIEALKAVALQAQNAAIDLAKENERLREALKKYGRHLDDCALTLGGYQCTCGFNQQEVPR